MIFYAVLSVVVMCGAGILAAVMLGAAREKSLLETFGPMDGGKRGDV